MAAGINLKSLNVFIKSFDYDKNQADHTFLTGVLKTCKTLENLKFNGLRFNKLNEDKKIKAKKLIDQYFIEETLIDYKPSDVWDIADF